MPRTKQRTSELRERVVRVAVSTLADEGFEGFSTRKVAERAETSIPAVYELFGARGGLVREIFFEGFRVLARRLDRLPVTDDPRRDLVRTLFAIRAFVRANPLLADVMFSRPFADFDPGPDDAEAGRAVREAVVGRVQRCKDAGELVGNATDVAHALLALVQGLAAQERAGWLGTSKLSISRRWALSVHAMLDGLEPNGKREEAARRGASPAL